MNLDDEEVEDPIEAQAASWLVRRDEGFSRSEAQLFDRWQRSDPRHAAAVERLEQACALLERLPQVPSLLPPVVAFPTGVRIESVEAKHLPRARFTLGRWGAGLAAALALGLGAWWHWAPRVVEFVHYATTAGGYERVVLADGSIVELNAASEITVSLAPRERRLTVVQGEAHFSVAHDATRPFLVTAGDVTVRAVGTAFNVQLGSGGVAILVTEGRVTVARREAGPRSAVVGPGNAPSASRSDGQDRPLAELGVDERLWVQSDVGGSIRGAPVVEKLDVTEVSRALAWQERKFVFAATPLREAVARFNRHNRLQLRIADEALAERPIGGTFAPDNIDGFVRLLEQSGAVSIDRTSEVELVLRQPK